MDALAENLAARLRERKPETAAEARERNIEVMELADQDLLDVARSRLKEQPHPCCVRDKPHPRRSGGRDIAEQS